MFTCPNPNKHQQTSSSIDIPHSIIGQPLNTFKGLFNKPPNHSTIFDEGQTSQNPFTTLHSPNTSKNSLVADFPKRLSIINSQNGSSEPASLLSGSIFSGANSSDKRSYFKTYKASICSSCRQTVQKLTCEGCMNKKSNETNSRHWNEKSAIIKDQSAKIDQLNRQAMELRERIERLNVENTKLNHRIIQIKKCSIVSINNNNQKSWIQLFYKCQQAQHYAHLIQTQIPQKHALFNDFLTNFELGLIKKMEEQLSSLPNKIRQVLERVEGEVKKQRGLLKETQRMIEEVIECKKKEFIGNNLLFPNQSVRLMLQPLQNNTKRIQQILTKMDTLKYKSAQLFNINIHPESINHIQLQQIQSLTKMNGSNGSEDMLMMDDQQFPTSPLQQQLRQDLFLMIEDDQSFTNN